MSEVNSNTAGKHSMMDLVRRLYPICRSITGNGVRETLAIVDRRLPLEIFEVPTGTNVFDWQIPKEWNIRDAYIENMSGDRIIDFHDHNLHVVNYSCPVDAVVERAELDKHLHSIPDHPDWIPYRTSYYTENWGFCLTQRQRDSLSDAKYRVKIDSDLESGSLTYGECLIPGKSPREILLYTHICHPSLCNDNLSGIAVTAAIGQELSNMQYRRYSYRLIFGPGTIGSITWLSQNQGRLHHIAHGLSLGLLGDDAHHTYKQTRSGDNEIDKVAAYVLTGRSKNNRIVSFSPYGYDERQFGSPGINLPIGRLTRSVNGGYPEYHSSADDLSLVNEDRLQESLGIAIDILNSLEENRYYVNLKPFCEPQLGKRGLYHSTGGTQIADRESAMLWLLNQADGTHSLLDIADKSRIALRSLAEVAAELVDAKLIEERDAASG